MISSFDYYKKIESPNMYLCNPDKRPICALNAENRHLILRFNDLSQLTFTVPKIAGTEDNYALVESKRLLFIEKIGWFQIESVHETTNGEQCEKEVTAQSHQYALKNRGFITEERVYMFYNPNDPFDEKYDSGNLAAMPSVVGQLYQQAGIKIALNTADIEATEDKIEWTITYVDPILKFKAKSYGKMYESADGYENVCRSFEANENLNGYDFIINNVEAAFEVIFEFDFLYHTIKIKTLDAITLPTDIYLSFDNIINNLTIKENSEDIVTVMSCNGGSLDIRTVNPMGTNYIVDFEYYKKRESDDGKIKFPWMSEGLINALDEWKAEWGKWKDSYSNLVTRLQALYVEQSKADEEIRTSNLKLTDMQAARDQYINNEDEDIEGAGIITGEVVAIGSKSLKQGTTFYNSEFTENSVIIGYTEMPKMTKSDDGIYTFSFLADGTRGTANSLIQNYYEEESGFDGVPIPMYFMDGDSRSYCKLNIDSIVEVAKDNNGDPMYFTHKSGDGLGAKTGYISIDGTEFVVSKSSTTDVFTISCGTLSVRFTSNSYFVYNGVRYRVLASADGIVSLYRYYVSGFDRFTTYKETAGVGGWCDIWENYIKTTLAATLNAINTQINSITQEMNRISEICNIQKFIKRKGDGLYDELSNYWIEGEYTNDNIATHDSTTMSERIDLAKELMAAGEIDLSKSAQPKFEMSVDAINFIKMYEFRQFTQELVLGKTITIEKSDGVYYRPALMSIEYDLDVADSFTMTFSNASKPGDTAMTFADLIKESSSTSRTVAANWSNLTDYTRNKESITNMIEAPLDRTLRAAQANMASQAFIIDDTGILGRKYDTDFDESNGTLSPKQLRIMNNVIIFTDDNWETAKTALGEIVLPDGTASYGLIAETIIGNIILGDNVIASNNDGSVTLTGNGIVIKNASGDVVLEALNNGNITIKNYASQSDLDALGKRVGAAETSIEANAQAITLKASQSDLDALGKRVGNAETAIQQTANEITAYAKKKEGDTSDEFSYVLAPTGFTLRNGNSIVFNCDKDGITINGSGTFSGTINASSGSFTGNVNATSGSIGAFEITNDGLESEYIKLNSKEIRFPIQSSFNLNDEVSIYTSQAGGVNTSYITTVNTSDFVIQNLTGAGIKFSKDKTAVTQTITLTFNGPNLSGAGDMGNALVVNHSIPSSSGGWTYSCDFNYTASLSAALPYPYSKTVYVRYLYNIVKTEYRVKAITLSFPAFTTSISGSANLDSLDEVKTRYNPNDSRFETGVYFSSYGSRTNQASSTVTSFSSTNNTLYSLGNFSPQEDRKYSLGANGNAWGNLYLYSGTQVGSDIRLKNSIEKLSDRYNAFFDNLTPVSYILNNGTSHRKHIGFIAQDVEASLNKADIDTKDFAGLCVPSEGELYYMLRYEEFIALNTAQIQQLKSKVNSLEKEISSLRNTTKNI